MDAGIGDHKVARSSTLDIGRIMQALPHRYPFLMLDRVVDMVPGISATGVKNVTVNEPYFQGHFPEQPVMPGVMIIEALAQTAALIVVETFAGESAKLVYFMNIDDAKFRRPVVPGDQLRLMLMKDRARGPVWRFKGRAMVGDVLAAEAVVTAMIADH